MSSQIESKKNSRKKNICSRFAISVFCLALILFCGIGGTLAFIIDRTPSIMNKFQESHVACAVSETFESNIKKNVNVTNTGDTEAYIRVKLISYRVNAASEHIGGFAPIPPFALGSGWVLIGDCYYYKYPVSAGKAPDIPLIGESGISLISDYSDADGGKQVIEVMAEAIQSKPMTAVEEAWGAAAAAYLEPNTSSNEITIN